ncbi:hypothetical protein ACHAWF_002697 [Thalassiosira exigua]
MCAFSNCTSLQRVELHNGLQKIGHRAFSNCDQLETLIIPSSVMAIGKGAFEGCASLSTDEFGQGVHHVQQAAFDGIYSQRIKIPTTSFVIEWGDYPSCALAEDPFIPSADGGVERTVVSGNLGQSEHLLAAVEEKINGILDRQDCTKEEKLGEIRSMIVHVKMAEATTCLELALLKASMDKERNLAAVPTTRKRRRVTKESYRVTCGAEIVIPNVLLFFYGS